MHAETNLRTLLEALLGTRRAEDLLASVAVPGPLLEPRGPRVSRGQLAFAMNLILLRDLQERVPSARAYMLDVAAAGGRVVFDHGALRTVLAPSGPLPPGEAAITRILRPLGYELADVYPLDRLSMTGRAYRHVDLPEGIPQFFLSELHPGAFSPAFQQAVARVLATSRDPLPERARAPLAELEGTGSLPLEDARALLPDLVACFDRQHEPPTLADYRILYQESAEMAWIATEGNAFNHATDRVADVEALAVAQKELGRSMKETVEVSASGRVLQTAFQADPVERPFRDLEGHMVLKTVPGSFFEFITRRPLAGGGLDLGFDTGNAQAIFKMTAPGSY
ncbi:DUF1338 domain-containing protein [Mesoterricola silvestris]|uniref:2-oxoadipate dioxygenase/decarboxylase n=1 Tax=Mesoterricola silvestris TaxID=2927979 RepID=A0AA48GT38_9BACT|nr:DUF1338 domain-containing protein [Mesoterricola silvestris]BDU73517.1 DUF1338 domain-containing protein [Mesoterricola silvestris]